MCKVSVNLSGRWTIPNIPPFFKSFLDFSSPPDAMASKLDKNNDMVRELIKELS